RMVLRPVRSSPDDKVNLILSEISIRNVIKRPLMTKKGLTESLHVEKIEMTVTLESDLVVQARAKSIAIAS
ncbi:MAG TPA: hypothetical protein PKI15_00370, partial [Candidatus Cloacimonadota bacterium]|nr:hypothetical protein [Candidatus Cloacimonadota bacterium]